MKKRKASPAGTGRELFFQLQQLSQEEQDVFINILLKDRTTDLGRMIDHFLTESNLYRSLLRITERHGKAKASEDASRWRNRNRKPLPETVRRNVEIIRQRQPGPNQLSQGQLANKHKVTDRYIRKVEQEAGKWIKLAAELPDEVVSPPRTE